MSSFVGCFCWEPVRPLGLGGGTGGEGQGAGVLEAEEASRWGVSERDPMCGLPGPEELIDPEGKGAPPSIADRPSQPKACWDTRVTGVAHGCHWPCDS